MAVVIIRKKDVNRLAKELLKEIFDFLHDVYIITNFEEMKKEQEKFLKNLAFNHIKSLKRKFIITEEKREELINKFSNNSESIKVLFISKLVEDAMKDEGIDTEEIYQTLNNLELDDEMHEDLHTKTMAFLDIFRVFESGYTFLED